MPYFVSALLAPILGPALYALFHGRKRAADALDRFVYIAVPFLVAWQVLPVAFERRSVVILVVALVGLLIPTLFERASRSLADRTDDLAIVVGLSGLMLHALLEGAAFAPWGSAVEARFGAAVALHRIPVALVIWWLIRPRHGSIAALSGVAALVLATLLGFVIGSEVLGPVHGPGLELYQAFVSGSLIHVVFHQGRHDHDHCHEHTGADGHHHRS
jgi:hypothetical protein